MLAIHLRVNGMGGLQPKPRFSMFAKKTCFCPNALISVTKDRKTQKINYGLGCRPPLSKSVSDSGGSPLSYHMLWRGEDSFSELISEAFRELMRA